MTSYIRDIYGELIALDLNNINNNIQGDNGNSSNANIINDLSISTDSVWSSSKTEDFVLNNMNKINEQLDKKSK